MTPEEKKLLEDTAKKLDKFLEIYYRTNYIDKTIFENRVYFRNEIFLPSKVAFFGANTSVAKQGAITPPSGGATVDSQARTAIGNVIAALQALGLTS